MNYQVWGIEQVDAESLKQMDAAMSLPISVKGALMPDAHVGYGLPIGGVLATVGAVIPYAVGVDIACRMRLSVFDVSPHVLGQQTKRFENALLENTVFGAGGEQSPYHQPQHEVMDESTWQETRLLSSLKDKGYKQLGTSGSGNHFVEWGEFTLLQDDAATGLTAGTYLALLSHSGSRGVGYAIANHYSRIAMNYHQNLDKSVRHLAWLDLSWHEGQEYWLSMNLAGRYASANHQVIHERVSKAVGLKPVMVVENHHNFAWQETIIDENGHEQDVIVHRKGATPAGKGVLGVIPGSMADPGFVVRGKGNRESLCSASHGAGRVMSRNEAKQQITHHQQNEYLTTHNVKLFGGSLDEAPQAYKDIHTVMDAQADLVEIVGKFQPRVVRMDGKITGKGKKNNRHNKRRR